MRESESGHIRGSPVAIVVTKAQKYPDSNGIKFGMHMQSGLTII